MTAAVSQHDPRASSAAADSREQDTTAPLMEIRQLYKRFSLSGDFLEQLKFKGGKLVREQAHVHAIKGIDIDIRRGEAVWVVGESGCGKTTVARIGRGAGSRRKGEID